MIIFYNAKKTQARRFSLAELRELTGFGSTSVHAVLELFAEATSDEGTISRQAFNDCFERIWAAEGKRTGDELAVVLGGLYDISSTTTAMAWSTLLS